MHRFGFVAVLACVGVLTAPVLGSSINSWLSEETTGSSPGGAYVIGTDPNVIVNVWVEVTGADNQGLANYVADVEILKDQDGNPATQDGAAFALTTSVSQTTYLDRFAIAPDTAHSGFVKDNSFQGGPGMSQQDQGTQTFGKLNQFAFGYSLPWVSAAENANFHMTPGVGQAAGLGVKDLVTITIDLPQTAGYYWIDLTPFGIGNNVLKTGLDFNNAVPGTFMEPAGSVTGGSLLIRVPEPASLSLLLAGGALVLRRRRRVQV